MKLTISKENLINGLQAVQNIVGSRSTLPVLSNVLLRAEGEHLELTTTDLDISIVSVVPAKVSKNGAATVPVKKFFGIIREMPAPEVEIAFDDRNVCHLQCGASYYKINGLGAEEFPPLPKFAEVRKVELPQEKVKGMIRKTSYASSADEARYILNGLFFSLKEHKMTTVATDGRRLAMAEEEVEIPTESQADFIVPSKAINELNRLMQSSGQVEIKSSQNQAMFTLIDEKKDTVVIISKLIEGTYPNYRQVLQPIEGDNKKRISLSREEFLQALRRAEFMTSDKANSVKLQFGNNTLSITANSPDVGEGQEAIAINYQDAEIAVAFNPVYLMDPLKALDNDEVFFELVDELSPGVIRINGPFLYVIMPMRTN